MFNSQPQNTFGNQQRGNGIFNSFNQPSNGSIFSNFGNKQQSQFGGGNTGGGFASGNLLGSTGSGFSGNSLPFGQSNTGSGMMSNAFSSNTGGFNAFGNAAGVGTSAFGRASNNQQGKGFGSSIFGNTQQSSNVFGNQFGNTSGSFGTSGAFGNTTTTGSIGARGFTTQSAHDFSPFLMEDTAIWSIAASNENVCVGELRWQAYQQGGAGGGSRPLGGTMGQMTSQSLFGGAPSMSIFSGNTSSTTGGMFGQTSSGSIFGNSSGTGALSGGGLFNSSTFGSQPNKFGTSLPTVGRTGGIFGSDNTASSSGIFGGTTSMSGGSVFGSTASNTVGGSNLFGSAAPASSSSGLSGGGGIFGQPSSTGSLFGTPQTGSLFSGLNALPNTGSGASFTGSGGGLFGGGSGQTSDQQQSTTLFGQPTMSTSLTTPQQSGGIFGSGTAASGGIFGRTDSLFGNTSSNAFGFGSSSQPLGSTSMTSSGTGRFGGGMGASNTFGVTPSASQGLFGTGGNLFSSTGTSNSFLNPSSSSSLFAPATSSGLPTSYLSNTFGASPISSTQPTSVFAVNSSIGPTSGIGGTSNTSADPYGLGNLFSSRELLLSTGVSSTSLLDMPYKPPSVQSLISGNSIMWKGAPSRLSGGRKYRATSTVSTRGRGSQHGSESFALPESVLQSTILKTSAVGSWTTSPSRDWLHPDEVYTRKISNNFTRYKSLFGRPVDDSVETGESVQPSKSAGVNTEEHLTSVEYGGSGGVMVSSGIEECDAAERGECGGDRQLVGSKRATQECTAHKSTGVMTSLDRTHLVPSKLSLPTAYESLCPQLTKEGYTTHPSMQTLMEMNEMELSRVPDFMVKREGYGEILWPGYTDTRQLNIDDIVSIEHLEVSVYTGKEEVPPEGVGLNRRAIISLKNCRPKNARHLEDPQIQEVYRRKVEKYTEKMGAKFISLDSSTWEWKFVVSHFSRYGLPKEWEEMLNVSELVDMVHTPLKDTSIQHKSTKVIKSNGDDGALVETQQLPLKDMSTPRLLTESLFSNVGITYAVRTSMNDMKSNFDVHSNVLDSSIISPPYKEETTHYTREMLHSSGGDVENEMMGENMIHEEVDVCTASRKVESSISRGIDKGMNNRGEMSEYRQPNMRSSLDTSLQYNELKEFKKQFDVPSQFSLHSSMSFHGRLQINANGLIALPSMGWNGSSYTSTHVTLLRISPMIEEDGGWDSRGVFKEEVPSDLRKLVRQHVKETVDGVPIEEEIERQRRMPRRVKDMKMGKVFYILPNAEHSISVVRTVPNESMHSIVKGFVDILRDCDLCHPTQQHIDRMIQHQLRCSKSNLNAYCGNVSRSVVEACKSIALDTYYLAPYALELWELMEALFIRYDTTQSHSRQHSCLPFSDTNHTTVKHTTRVSNAGIQLSHVLQNVEKWLETVNTRSIVRHFEKIAPTKCKGSAVLEEDPTLLSVFHLLTAGKVPEAIDCLFDGTGDKSEMPINLMSLIALHSHREIDQDSLELQLNHLKDISLHNKLDSGMLLLYQLLGGVLVEKPSKCALDWRATLAMHLWYPRPRLDIRMELQAPPHASDGPRTLQRAVNNYEESFNRAEQSTVIPALPPYFATYRISPQQLFEETPKMGCSTDVSRLDAQYHLLKMYSGLLPFNLKYFDVFTHTPYGLDCSLTWPVVVLLWLCNSAGLFGYTSSPEMQQLLSLQLTRVNALFASQLEMMGLWYWACFAVMLTPNNGFGRSAVREILFRNVIGNHLNESDDAELQQIRQIVVKTLGIPSAWWEEAVALQLQFTCRHIEAAFHFYSAFKKLRSPQLSCTATQKSWYGRTIGSNCLEEKHMQNTLAVEYLVGCANNMNKFLPTFLLNIIHREYDDVPDEAERIGLETESTGITSFDAKCSLILDVAECCEEYLQASHPCLMKLQVLMLCFRWLVCTKQKTLENPRVAETSTKVEYDGLLVEEKLEEGEKVDEAAILSKRIAVLRREMMKLKEEEILEEEDEMIFMEMEDMMVNQM